MYHTRVMDEMERRGFKPDEKWRLTTYRGKTCDPDTIESLCDMFDQEEIYKVPAYPEHNDEYLQECLENLERKGIHIERGDLYK